jgi:hypothetical protein
MTHLTHLCPISKARSREGPIENSKIPRHFDPSFLSPLLMHMHFSHVAFEVCFDKRMFAQKIIIRMRLTWFCCCYWWVCCCYCLFRLSLLRLTLATCKTYTQKTWCGAWTSSSCHWIGSLFSEKGKCGVDHRRSQVFHNFFFFLLLLLLSFRSCISPILRSETRRGRPYVIWATTREQSHPSLFLHSFPRAAEGWWDYVDGHFVFNPPVLRSFGVSRHVVIFSLTIACAMCLLVVGRIVWTSCLKDNNETLLTHRYELSGTRSCKCPVGDWSNQVSGALFPRHFLPQPFIYRLSTFAFCFLAFQCITRLCLRHPRPYVSVLMALYSAEKGLYWYWAVWTSVSFILHSSTYLNRNLPNWYTFFYSIQSVLVRTAREELNV